MQQRKICLAFIALFMAGVLLSSCSRTAPSDKNVSSSGKTGTITTAKPVPAATRSIGPEGGTLTVRDPGSPVSGLAVTIPPDSYSNATEFKVSYSAVEKHTFGEAFNPITPVITVENGGSRSGDPIQVKMQVEVPEGHFAMGFLYDAENKQLEGLPLIARDGDSITVATEHFSSIIFSSIDLALLYKDIDSGFRPGVDDWQFTNYGSQIAPGGHCSGQSMTAMWYYIERPDGKDISLWGRYDNNGAQPGTPKFWEDDSLGYRFSSVVQADHEWDTRSARVFNVLNKLPEETWRLFAYSMLVTGEPQLAGVYNTNAGGGHALVVYRISGGNLYVADPNYPGMALRKIEYADGRFKPYSSGANADEIAQGNAKEYDLITYYAKTALVDWEKVGQRWEQVKNGTIGDESFLSYETVWLDARGDAHKLTDGFVSPNKTLAIGFHYDGGQPTNWRVYRDGVRLTAGPRLFPGTSSYELNPGNNSLGILLNAMVNGKERYIDFKYLNVIYNEPPPEEPKAATPNTTSGEKRWKLVETILPTLPEMPVNFSDQFGSHSMTLTVTENKIVSDVRTKGPNGTETGSSVISLSINKMPESVTAGQKIDMIGTWEIKTSGTPRYTSSAVELRRGEFSGKSTPIRSEQNPAGSLTFTWSPGGDEFEVTARLTVRGDAGRIKWIYRLEK